MRLDQLTDGLNDTKEEVVAATLVDFARQIAEEHLRPSNDGQDDGGHGEEEMSDDGAGDEEATEDQSMVLNGLRRLPPPQGLLKEYIQSSPEWAEVLALFATAATEAAEEGGSTGDEKPGRRHPGHRGNHRKMKQSRGSGARLSGLSSPADAAAKVMAQALSVALLPSLASIVVRRHGRLIRSSLERYTDLAAALAKQGPATSRRLLAATSATTFLQKAVTMARFDSSSAAASMLCNMVLYSGTADVRRCILDAPYLADAILTPPVAPAHLPLETMLTLRPRERRRLAGGPAHAVSVIMKILSMRRLPEDVLPLSKLSLIFSCENVPRLALGVPS